MNEYNFDEFSYLYRPSSARNSLPRSSSLNTLKNNKKRATIATTLGDDKTIFTDDKTIFADDKTIFTDDKTIFANKNSRRSSGKETIDSQMEQLKKGLSSALKFKTLYESKVKDISELSAIRTNLLSSIEKTQKEADKLVEKANKPARSFTGESYKSLSRSLSVFSKNLPVRSKTVSATSDVMDKVNDKLEEVKSFKIAYESLDKLIEKESKKAEEMASTLSIISPSVEENKKNYFRLKKQFK
jgi:hypothetical protein